MTTRSHITVILDRTGSMESIRDDVIGGYNAFLAQQQAAPGSATLTLVQFDSQDPYEVLQADADLATVPPLTREQYVPRASTPLYDAIGRGILELEVALAKRRKAERPEQVVFVIVTDGAENASREFDRARVNRLIQAKTGLGWQFVYLAGDLGAFAEAHAMGIAPQAALHFAKSKQGNDRAWELASGKVLESRRMPGAPVEFSEAQRKSAAE